MSDQQRKPAQSSFWDDLNGRLEDPKFRRGYIIFSLRLQGATRWQIFKYRITNWRKL